MKRVIIIVMVLFSTGSVIAEEKAQSYYSLDVLYGSYRPVSFEVTPWSVIFPMLDFGTIRIDDSVIYTTEAMIYGSGLKKISDYFNFLANIPIDADVYNNVARKHDADVFKGMVDRINARIIEEVQGSFEEKDLQLIKTSFNEELRINKASKRMSQYFFEIYEYMLKSPALLDMIVETSYGYILIGKGLNGDVAGKEFCVSPSGEWKEILPHSSFASLLSEGYSTRWFPWIYIKRDTVTNPINEKTYKETVVAVSFVAPCYGYKNSIVRSSGNIIYDRREQDKDVFEYAGIMQLMAQDTNKWYAPLILGEPIRAFVSLWTGGRDGQGNPIYEKNPLNDVSVDIRVKKKEDKGDFEVIPFSRDKIEEVFPEQVVGLNWFLVTCSDGKFGDITGRHYVLKEVDKGVERLDASYRDIDLYTPRELKVDSTGAQLAIKSDSLNRTFYANSLIEPFGDKTWLTVGSGSIPYRNAAKVGAIRSRGEIALTAYKLTENDAADLYPLFPVENWMETFNGLAQLLVKWTEEAASKQLQAVKEMQLKVKQEELLKNKTGKK